VTDAAVTADFLLDLERKENELAESRFVQASGTKA
jgi:hypothetical protein